MLAGSIPSAEIVRATPRKQAQKKSNPPAAARETNLIVSADHSNNNWATTIIGGIITSNQVHEIQASGYVPGDGRESAIIADLSPGNYTAIVRGVNNTTSVALVEVYELDSGAF